MDDLDSNLYVNAGEEELEKLIVQHICKRKRRRRRNRKKKAEGAQNGDCGLSDALERVALNEKDAWKLSIRAVLDHGTGTVIKCRRGERRRVSSKFHTSTNIPMVYVTKSFVKYEGIRAVVVEEVLHGGTVNFDLPNGTNADLQPPGLTRQQVEQKMTENCETPEQLGKFGEYWRIEDVNEGLTSGNLIKGVIRVNRKNNQQSFVSHGDDTSKDYLIASVRDRNRALDGDVVALKLKPPSQWEGDHETAIVVYICERVSI